MENSAVWGFLGNSVNNAFFFVADKIIDLQGYFIWYAKGVGRVVFLIAICTAALNYALTGTGLKENLIKIFKATVFFLIVISVYPRIVGWITAQTFIMADGSIRPSVESYFYRTVQKEYNAVVSTGSDHDSGLGTVTISHYRYKIIQNVTEDYRGVFGEISTTRKHPRMGEYTAINPAALFKVLLLIAGDMIDYGDRREREKILPKLPDFGRILKGYVCGGFIIATGCFALLEYLICFLEFMLVTSVGVILFPLSIWEGSKFMSEKFIGAVVGFFMKMLFCNIAIFLLIYGFVSLYHIFGENQFQGMPEQIAYTIFVCLLFFYICKSAPGIAQSLLTGTPSLSATGAISAAAGAVGAVTATAGLARKAGKLGGTVVGGGVGGIAKTGFGIAGSLVEANAAKHAAMDSVNQGGGGMELQKAVGGRAFRSSLASDAGNVFKSAGHGLSRRLLGGGSSGGGGTGGGSTGGGGGNNPYSWRQDFLNNQVQNKDGNGYHNQTVGEHFNKRREEGKERGEFPEWKF